jgi:hypothetical protein
VIKNDTGRACGTYGAQKRCIQVLVGGPDVKRPLGSLRCRWEDNIKIYFREVGWGGMDWSELAQDRDKWRTLVNAVMNLLVP